MPFSMSALFDMIGVAALITTIVIVIWLKQVNRRTSDFYIEIQKQKDSTNHRFEDLNADINLQHDSLKRVSETLSSEAKTLHAAFHTLRNLMNDNNESSFAEMKKLAGKIENINSRIDHFAKAVQEIQKINNTHSDSISDLSAALDETKVKITNLEVELFTLRREIQTLSGTKNPPSINSSPEPEPEPEPKQETGLIEEKQKLFDLMENTMQNLLITGKGGTGKSYLLKYFMQHTKKTPVYCAPTGMAAINIHGITLHSFFRYNNLQIGKKIQLDDKLKSKLNAVSVLVIDEISMVNADMFQKIDLMFRMADKSRANLPFAGRQIILFGDLFQLPPIIKKGAEEAYMKEHYSGHFFFNAPAFINGGFTFHELQLVFRFKDDPVNQSFIKTLDRIREGEQTKEDVAFLNQRVLEVPVHVPMLTARRKSANKTNKEELSKLRDFASFVYPATITPNDPNRKPLSDKDLEKLQKDVPCALKLELKKGALVMMVSNDPGGRWVNGTVGIVSSLSEKQVFVSIAQQTYEIEKEVFEQIECEFDPIKKELKYTPVNTVTQFPLVLAYAITIHKAQGQTYQSVACNVSNSFDPGQAYVALSRCEDYNHLYLTKKISIKTAFAAKEAIDFYKEHKLKQ